MANGSDLSCPSCGVAIEGVSAHTRSLQCPHCANWVYLSNNGWTNGGLFEHALDAPSMLHIGRSGRIESGSEAPRHFFVAGRIRVSYASGYWDEWWLEFEDGQHQWLEEDDGSYQLHTATDLTLEPQRAMAAIVGSNLEIGDANWFVTERVEAEITGTEGSLPVAVVPMEQIICIDAMGGGTEVSIEASGLDINITQSRPIAASALLWD